MGLETATYVSDLVSSNPVASDPRGQGDDHLRLIKSALQSTFPNASRAFRFPTAEAVSGTMVLDATDDNNHVIVDTTAGNVAITLPSGLGTGDKGWRCYIIKTSSDLNAAIVSPASGTIASKVGSTATIRVGILCEPATFLWTGTAWICSKPGQAIGSSITFYGAGTLPGHLEADNSAYSNTAFAELFAAIATATVPDIRGRVESGIDAGTGRAPGYTLLAAGGAPTVILDASQLPFTAYSLNGTTDPVSVTTTRSDIAILPSGWQANSSGGGSFNYFTAPPGGNFTGAVASAGSFTPRGTIGPLGSNVAHPNIQATIAGRKFIRAC